MALDKAAVLERIKQLRGEREALAGERRIRGEMRTLNPNRPDKLLREAREKDAVIAELEQLVGE